MYPHFTPLQALMSSRKPGGALFPYHRGGWELRPASESQFLAPTSASAYLPMLPLVSSKRFAQARKSHGRRNPTTPKKSSVKRHWRRVVVVARARRRGTGAAGGGRAASRADTNPVSWAAASRTRPPAPSCQLVGGRLSWWFLRAQAAAGNAQLGAKRIEVANTDVQAKLRFQGRLKHPPRLGGGGAARRH
jgi:hypothetical protein